MAELKFPVVELEKEKFQVVVDMALYAKKAVVATCNEFTNRFYIPLRFKQIGYLTGLSQRKVTSVMDVDTNHHSALK